MFELAKMEVLLNGPMAFHNHPCAVCRKNHSVLDLNAGVMLPCWDCQSQGWTIKKLKPRRLSRFWKALQHFPGGSVSPKGDK